MPQPATSALAERLYDGTAQIGKDYKDPDLGYPLLKFLAGWSTPMLILEEVVRDSDDSPGWSAVLDVDRSPAMFLPWLGQFVGIRRTGGETDDQLRIRIRNAAGLRRGGPQSIKDAVAATLASADPDNVQLIERHGSAYRLTVSTLLADTPSPQDTWNAIVASTPAGIVVAHGIIIGNTYNDLLNTHATYTEVLADFATYNAVLADPTHT